MSCGSAALYGLIAFRRERIALERDRPVGLIRRHSFPPVAQILDSVTPEKKKQPQVGNLAHVSQLVTEDRLELIVAGTCSEVDAAPQSDGVNVPEEPGPEPPRIADADHCSGVGNGLLDLREAETRAFGTQQRELLDFLLRRQQTDVLVGMGLAGLVNAAMLVISAALFFGTDIPATDTLEGVHAGLARVLDQPAAFAFALALLASGFASSGVGTYAGQVVMQGFIARSIPLVVRRAVTMSPALLVLALGLEPSRALVLSQVALSFGIPFALIPLVMLSSRKSIMGEFVNRRLTTVAAVVVAIVIIGLNVFLLGQTFFG